MNNLEKVYFINRLASLQALCSESDETFPKAVMLIPGADGRNNASSITVLKYLFFGATGKDLFDDALDDAYAVLEDIVVLVKQTSLTVVYSEAMKKIIYPTISLVPNLIEYVYTKEEEMDIDKFQEKKCINFKKMMLESVNPRDSIYIPVPTGYDDILEVEGWPLLQAFALDSIICPTGFFTARYNIVDLTSNLEILYRTLDSFYLENTIEVMNTAIIPHMTQFINALESMTISQRERITADEAIGPLDVLYEFGEMNAYAPLETANRPVALFGQYSSFIGNTITPKALKWKEQKIGQNLHCVVESTEPTCGMRWCRTYFFQHGTNKLLIGDLRKLHAGLSGIASNNSNGNPSSLDEDEADDEDDADQKEEDESAAEEKNWDLHIPNNIDASIRKSNSEAIQRIQQLYMKLTISLRLIVNEVFLSQYDVLESATIIQERLVAIMNDANHIEFPIVELLNHEKLQIHMDCLNALGEIINVDDVDDMGGICWTYIRASIHGIKVGLETLAIAVGDTFLFSPLSVASNKKITTIPFTYAPFLTDQSCLTHGIPYYRCLLGYGIEEDYSRFVNYASRSSSQQTLLKLGKPMDYTTSGTITLPILTNHSMIPYFQGEIKCFTAGLIIERMDQHSSVPMVISFAEHIESVQIVDLKDGLEQSNVLQNDFIPTWNGFLIVYTLKSFANTDSGSSYTVADKALPNLLNQSCTQLVICIHSNDRNHAMISNLLNYWKSSYRLYDIEEKKGKEQLLSQSLRYALLCIVHSWIHQSQSSSTISTLLPSTTSFHELYTLYDTLTTTYGSPMMASIGLRLSYTLSEGRKGKHYEYESFVNNHDAITTAPATAAATATATAAVRNNNLQSIVFVALPGINITHITKPLFGNLQNTLSLTHYDVIEEMVLDLTTLPTTAAATTLLTYFQDQFDTILLQSKAKKSSILLNIALVLNPLLMIPVMEIIAVLQQVLGNPILQVTSIVVPDMLFPTINNTNANANANSIGEEYYHSQGLALLHPGISDQIIVLTAATNTANTTTTSSKLIATANITDSYTLMRQYLDTTYEQTGSTRHLLRLLPHPIHFPEEDIQQYADTLNRPFKPQSNVLVNERLACDWLLGYPVLTSGLLMVPRKRSQATEPMVTYPTSLKLTTPVPLLTTYTHELIFTKTATTTSAASSVVSVAPAISWVHFLKLLQLLFPRAKVYNTNVKLTYESEFIAQTNNTLKQPKKKNHWSRLLEIASMKALYTIHQKELDTSYRQGCQKVSQVCPGLVSSMIGQLHSLTGRVYGMKKFPFIPSDHQYCDLIVEANAGYILLHEIQSYPVASMKTMTSSLQWFGRLPAKAFEQMGTLLLPVTAFHPIQSKPMLSPATMTQQDKEYIQNLHQFYHLPLPAGWWYDGHFFIDHSGGQYTLRPDIVTIVEEYVVQQNKQRVQYNTLLEEFGLD